MKALSIISLVISVISILESLFVLSIECYNCSGDGTSYPNENLPVGGIALLLISFWFLAFSIVATVVSFKKKKVSA